MFQLQCTHGQLHDLQCIKMQIYVSFQEKATYSSELVHLSQWFPTRTHSYLQLSPPTDLFWPLGPVTLTTFAPRRNVFWDCYIDAFTGTRTSKRCASFTSRSLVQQHLEYGAPVWSPHLHTDITMVERTQQFASKMCTKPWDFSYNELLDRLHLPTLAQRRLHLSLCFLYRIIHGLLYFPPNVFVPSSTSSHYTRPYSLYQPFARTDSYLHSFLPNTVPQWNTLPEYVVASPSLSSFKRNLSPFTL